MSYIQNTAPAGGSGTVTSVGLATGAGATDALYTISGSPVTTSGTLVETLNTQTANRVFAGPTSGGAATPTFRALVAADLPAGTGTVTSVAMTGDGVIFNATVAGSPITTSGTLVPALLTQTANRFLAGPTSGGAATPTFRAIVAADIPSGTVTWDQIGSAAADLTLANTTFNTTFNQTSTSATWTWANTTASTSGVSQNSCILALAGTYWTGAASAADTWKFQNGVSNGTNGNVSLLVTHAGSTGTKTVLWGAAGNQAMGHQFFGTTSSGFSLTASASGGSCNIANLGGGNVSFIGASGLTLQGSGTAQVTLGTTVKLLPAGVNTFEVTSGTGVTTFRNVATTGSGLPAQYASVPLTAQTAAITATTLYAVPAAGIGLYRISWAASITTAATTSSVLGGTNGFQILYTSPTDSVVKTTVAGNSITTAANTTATAIGGDIIVYAKASTNIQYQFDYTSVGVTPMAFEIHIKCEYMGN